MLTLGPTAQATLMYYQAYKLDSGVWFFPDLCESKKGLKKNIDVVINSTSYTFT
jgi:hypothetical protein